MSKSSFGVLRLGSVALLGFVWFQACSASDSGPLGLGSGGSMNSSGSGGTKVVMPNLGGVPSEAGMGGYNALCGLRADGCVPDSPESCRGFVAPQAALLGAGGAGGNFGGAAGAAGALDPSAEAGAGGHAGAEGTPWGGAGGDPSTSSPGGGGASGNPDYACRVAPSAGAALAQCSVSGSGDLDAPCFSGEDCAAGLECVRVSSVARCRPYCCAGESACDAFPGSYCSEMQLASAGARVVLQVPVCAAAEQCSLSEPFPCPEGRVCQCPDGTACSVVRSDGTTACVEPGKGVAGQACPCSAGHVCSQSALVCLKLCSLSSAADAMTGCGTGKCQSSTELPAGYGVCVDVR